MPGTEELRFETGTGKSWVWKISDFSLPNLWMKECLQSFLIVSEGSTVASTLECLGWKSIETIKCLSMLSLCYQVYILSWMCSNNSKSWHRIYWVTVVYDKDKPLNSPSTIFRRTEGALALKHEGECPEDAHGTVRLSFFLSSRNSCSLILGMFT